MRAATLKKIIASLVLFLFEGGTLYWDAIAPIVLYQDSPISDLIREQPEITEMVAQPKEPPERLLLFKWLPSESKKPICPAHPGEGKKLT